MEFNVRLPYDKYNEMISLIVALFALFIKARNWNKWKDFNNIQGLLFM